MADPNEPKTRFDIVSPGIGRASGGIVTLLIGMGVTGSGFAMDIPFLRDAGLTMTMTGVILVAYGAFRVYRGIGAQTRSIKCPSCGEVNQVLAKVTSFNCFKCDKPLKLGAKKSPVA